MGIKCREAKLHEGVPFILDFLIYAADLTAASDLLFLCEQCVIGIF